MLNIKELCVCYNGQHHRAVQQVSFNLLQGVFGGLVGESGSGKTSIIMAALGLLPAGSVVTGAIDFEGQNLLTLDEETMRRLRWKKIALVPQSAQNSFTPVKTIGAHIEEVLRVHLHLSGKAAKARATRLLTEAELNSAVASRYPHELSGGQKQRAAIALALACEPSLLLADEPTTALDVVTQAGILRLLCRLRREKQLTVLLVTHDLPMAASVCSQLFVMKDGRLVECGAPKELLTAANHPYTRQLVRAIL